MHFVIDLDSFEQLIDKKLDEVAADIFSKSQENLVKNGSIDTGELLKTANLNTRFLEKEIVYPALHASFIEFGTHPHPISEKGIKSLQGWAHRKLGLSEKEAKKVAWAIAMTIKQKGMEAKPYIRPAIEAVLEGL